MTTLQYSSSSTGDLFVRPTYPIAMPNGKLCVADSGAHRLVLLSAAGKRVKQPKRLPVLNLPTGVACSDSSIYVADQGTHQIHRLDLSDFSPAGIAGGPGSGVGQLTSPQGLVLYRDVLYVSDSLNHRVAMFHPLLLDPLGEPFGHEGAGAGELCYPHGLAVVETDGDALLVVADTQNHRLQMFSLVGDFVRAIGAHGVAPGEFVEPMGLAACGGLLHVAERERVQTLSYDGAPLCVLPLSALPQPRDLGSSLAAAGASRLCGIAAMQRRVYVCDSCDGSVHVLQVSHEGAVRGGAASGVAAGAGSTAMEVDGAEGAPREARGYDGGDEPHGRDDGAGGEAGEAGVETLAADMEMADADETPLMNPDVLSALFDSLRLQHFLPVASVCHLWANSARAKALELRILRYQRSLGGDEGADEGADEGGAILSHPTQVLLLPTGEVVVSESATSKLLLLSAEGVLLSEHGGRGRGPSDVHYPQGLASDGTHLYVADGQNARVVSRQLPDMQPIGSSDDTAVDDERVLRRPDGLVVAGGRLYISDKAAHCIAVFTLPEMRYELSFGSRGSGDGELCDPSGLALLSAKAEIVVADVSNHRLQCFSLVGEYTRQIGRSGRAPGCFHLPTGVETVGGDAGGGDAVLVVAERRRIQVLTLEGVPLQVVTPPLCGSLHGVSARAMRVLVADSEQRRLHEFQLQPRNLRNALL